MTSQELDILISEHEPPETHTPHPLQLQWLDEIDPDGELDTWVDTDGNINIIE